LLKDHAVALAPDDDGTERIPLAEERVRIATRETVRGAVQVHLTTEEVEETLRATLRGRHASVERVPIGRDVDEAPRVRQEGDVVIVPVVEEVLVVERRLRLREELHLRLQPVEEEVEVPVRRRVQHAEVSRRDAASAGATGTDPSSASASGTDPSSAGASGTNPSSPDPSSSDPASPENTP